MTEMSDLAIEEKLDCLLYFQEPVVPPVKLKLVTLRKGATPVESMSQAKKRKMKIMTSDSDSEQSPDSASYSFSDSDSDWEVTQRRSRCRRGR